MWCLDVKGSAGGAAKQEEPVLVDRRPVIPENLVLPELADRQEYVIRAGAHLQSHRAGVAFLAEWRTRDRAQAEACRELGHLVTVE